MIRRQKIRTAIELQAVFDSCFDEESDEEENFIQHADAVDIIITPPDVVDNLSDNEELDDNVQLLRDEPELPNEIAGQFEIECVYNDCNEYMPAGCDNDTVSYEPEEEQEDDTPVASTSRKAPKRPRIDEGIKPKWSRSHNYQFDKIPFDDTTNSYKALYEQIGAMNPVQLWEMFIDEEVLHLLATSTNHYATTNNCPSFITSTSEIKTFLGVLYITGYHTLPQIHSYWSNRESLGCALIKECMSMDRFKRIKQFFHVCDNSALDPKNKFAKVAPLNDLLNKKFLQFGIFSHHLSIDEQMIAYYGRHSCKMFIKGKPIRFGYKYWCLASVEGYLYQLIPYAGASEQVDPGFGLGERVVLSLLSHVEDRAKHTVTFDNFFTSHKLMTRLSNDGYFALGTVRDNRTNHADLMHVKEMKKPRGTSDFRFDKNNSILAVRWNDNSVVTLLSNFLSHTPTVRAKRYDRKKRKMVAIEQPHLVNQYNQRMGGVDLFDNAMNNYRIRIRGKKWYWPLITNAFDAAMVNAWKLHCLCRKYENKIPMPQFDFRVEVCESIMIKSNYHHPGRTSASGTQLAMRHDRIDHFIGKLNTRHRCPQCGGKTEYGCLKCKVNLHPAPCFLDYHNGAAPDDKKIAKAKYWAVTNIDYIHSRTSRRVFLMIFFVWTAAVIVSLAPQFGWKDPDYLQRIEQQKCMVSQDIAYQIFATCCTFYVPLLVILFLYWKIYQTARKRIHRRRPKPINVTGNNNQPDLTTQKKRKRLRLRIGKFTNNKTNVGTTLGLVEGNSTNTVNTVEVEDTEFSSSNMDSKSRAGIEVTNLNLNNTEEVPSSSATNNQQIATVSHLVALANQTHQTLSKTQPQPTQTIEKESATTTTIKTKTSTTSCLTQPVQVQENPLEPFKVSTTTTAAPTAAARQPPTCIEDMAANEIPAISSSANGTVVLNNNNNNNNNNNHHHHHNHPTLEVLEDPQLQQQLQQVQQQTQNCDNKAQTPTTPIGAVTGCGAAAATSSIMHKTQGASTSNATTITSISALSPQTPTVTTPSSAPLPHHSHIPNPPSAYASSQVTPVPRPKHPQQQLSSIENPMHKVTKRKETLEAKRERKAAKTLAIITGAFVVCWLPFFAMALLLPLCESCEINDAVASFFLWLGYFNSTLNPVIYTIFSPEFRQAFKRILFGGHRPVHYRSGKL